ncbi:MAG: FtsQ-type POTRA domain-containing protein, partial [Bacilli bacterium]|nr:FtsQ-type POTRA domain-containing protein [Bacilli bacterium]
MTSKKVTKKIVKKKKRKINFRKLTLTVIFLVCSYLMIIILLNLKITNIYIGNNTYLSDQKIIDLAKISNYPATIKNSSKVIENRLIKSIYIKSVKVYKKWLTSVYIEVEENNPLFYNLNTEKTVLSDASETSDIFSVPTLINVVPDEQYKELITVMNDIDSDILKRISEIEYDPNSVDSYRFLLYMND